MKTRPYIAYYRVSTDRQGRSGLGLEAQQQAVCSFLQGRGELVASFVEVESGRRNDRPEIAAALDACRKQKAMLIIAKLDRLARNVHFISGLMESGVEFGLYREYVRKPVTGCKMLKNNALQALSLA